MGRRVMHPSPGSVGAGAFGREYFGTRTGHRDGKVGGGGVSFEMVSEDRPKLPRASVHDEKLYIEGEEEPYFRDPEYTIWLRVAALTVQRGYQPKDFVKNTGDKVLIESLRGLATVEREDRFAVVGFETERTPRIEFRLTPIPDLETEFHWHAVINFNIYDLEFPDWEEGFWITGYCTRQFFDDLLTAVRRGHVDNIRVGMRTTMWTKDNSRTIRGRTWHLVPDAEGDSKELSTERGNISSLVWEEKFGLHSTAETRDHDEAMAPPAPPPKPQLAASQTRFYSMLSAVLAIAAMVLVLTFLR